MREEKIKNQNSREERGRTIFLICFSKIKRLNKTEGRKETLKIFLNFFQEKMENFFETKLKRERRGYTIFFNFFFKR